MSDAKNKRLVLAGSAQIASLIRGNPEILNHVPRLAPLLNSAPAGRSQSSGCGCNRNNSQQTATEKNRVQAENILSTLSNEDFIKIKNVLGVGELCYYTRNNPTSQLDLICV